MPRKPQGVAHGIFNRLQADPKLYADFLGWLYEENASWREIVKRLKERGVPTSDGALSALRSSHSTALRMDYARLKAERALEDLPENASELTRRGLQKRIFEAVFTGVTTEEVVALERVTLMREKLELERSRLALDREKLEMAKTREEKTREVLGDRQLTAEEKNNRLKEVFGIQ